MLTFSIPGAAGDLARPIIDINGGDEILSKYKTTTPQKTENPTTPQGKEPVAIFHSDLIRIDGEKLMVLGYYLVDTYLRLGNC